MAMVVVFPVCLPMQAIMRFAGSLRSFSWKGKGLKSRINCANSEEFSASCFKASAFEVIFV